jgi:hypothetical protein
LTVNPPAKMAVQQLLGGNLILNWPAGTLQSATNITGPWSDVSGATAPRTNPAAARQEFFRIKLQ